MISPFHLLDNILNCFGKYRPATIVLGGSYTTNESGNIVTENKLYALSDFDLLCITDAEYKTDIKLGIYKNMLKLSRSIDQANPYFHIGLKIRTPVELKLDVNSLYFKELSITGKTLIGNEFSSYFDSNVIFGFNHFPKEVIYEKLYSCGLTRLWCNILFFPIKSLIYPRDNQWNIWYSYFFSRGAMDWITFKLIENNKWSPSYTERFNIWNSEFSYFEYAKLMKQCFEMKIGKNRLDFREIFYPILSYSLSELFYYANKIDIPINNPELRFIVLMLNFLDNYIQNNESDRQILKDAKINLEKLTNKKINVTDDPWKCWHSLRSLYSNYRFSKNEIDKLDHTIYTNHFLTIGAS